MFFRRLYVLIPFVIVIFSCKDPDMTGFPLIVDAGNDITVEKGTLAVLSEVRVEVPRGADIYYRWSFKTIPQESSLSDDSIQGAASKEAKFRPDAAGDYILELEVVSGLGSGSDTIRVRAESNSPVADGGPNRSVQVNTDVTLDGSASYDPNGSSLDYCWELKLCPEESSLTSSDIIDADSVHAVFHPDCTGKYVVKLTVSNDQYSNSDIVEIIALFAIHPPVVDAGEDSSCETGELCQLQGTALDEDGDDLTYLWTIIDKPEGSVISDNSISGRTTDTAYFRPDTDGMYKFRLSVSDGGVIVHDDVTVTVEDPLYSAGDLREIDIDGTTVRFRYVPAGLVFPIGYSSTDTSGGLIGQYGSTDENDPEYQPAFWAAETEVTNELAVKVLNWALDNGKLVLDGAGQPRMGGHLLVNYFHDDYLISFDGSSFSVAQRDVPALRASEIREGNPGFDEAFDAYKAGSPEPAIDCSDYPCVSLSWYGCVMLCNWMTEMYSDSEDNMVYYVDPYDEDWLPEDFTADYTRRGFRLPRSMEWECAARYIGVVQPEGSGYYTEVDGFYWTNGLCPSGGINNVDNYTDSNPNIPDYTDPVLNVGWYLLNSHELDSEGHSSSHLVFHGGGGERDENGTLTEANPGGHIVGSCRVGMKAPNALGIYDMSGNIWEYCFETYPDTAVGTGHDIIRRGGGFTSHYFFLYVGRILNHPPENFGVTNGFRLFISE